MLVSQKSVRCTEGHSAKDTLRVAKEKICGDNITDSTALPKPIRRSMLGQMRKKAKKKKPAKCPGCYGDVAKYLNVFRKEKSRSKRYDEKLGGTIKTQLERVRYAWHEADGDGDGHIDMSEIINLMNSLGVSAPTAELQIHFDTFDVDKNGHLDFEEFYRMFLAIDSKPSLEEEFLIAYLLGNDIDESDPEIRNKYLDSKALSRFLFWASGGKESPSEEECEYRIYSINNNIDVRPVNSRINQMTKSKSFESPPTLVQENTGGRRNLKSLNLRKFRTGQQAKKTETRSFLDYDGFVFFLTAKSSRNAANQEKVNTVYQDMSRPLCDYYISSSHNSYLMGNQLSGESTAYAITRALRLGVRVIELDAWNGPRNQPIVTHGGTLCSPILFRECLEALKESGFVASEYPVIITIENHCSMKQQLVQVQLLEEILGDQLYRFTLQNHLKDGPNEWASPEELKRKFVIRDKPKKSMSAKDMKFAKGKHRDSLINEFDSIELNHGDSEMKDMKVVNGTQACVINEEIGRSDSQLSVQDELYHDGGQIVEPLTVIKSIMETVSSVFVPAAEDFHNSNDTAYDFLDEKSDGVVPELLQVMYIKNVSLPLIKNKELDSISFHSLKFKTSSSISETKMLKLTSPGVKAAALSTYANEHLVRVYPDGTRVMSSNYDPMPAWNCGCQIVALNYQTFGPFVWLNQAKFSDNGGCGYVLKPLAMREAVPVGKLESAADASIRQSKVERMVGPLCLGGMNLPWALQQGDASYDRVSCKLIVNLISGHHLPHRLEETNPYVEISLRGLPQDDDAQVSHYVEDNRFDPSWRETFQFDVRSKELAIVTFTVRSHKHGTDRGKFLGQAAVPLICLNFGFRVLPLRYGNCALIDDAYLFIKLNIEE